MNAVTKKHLKAARECLNAATSSLEDARIEVPESQEDLEAEIQDIYDDVDRINGQIGDLLETS